MSDTFRFGAMQGILEMDARDAVEAAADAGSDGLELVVDGPEPEDDSIWRAEDRGEIQEAAAEAGIELPSIVLGFLNRGGVTSDGPTVRETARDAIRRSVEVAADLDAVVLVPFFADGEIEAVVDDAEASDVTLALETTLSGAAQARLLDRIGSPAARIYYDVSNAIWWGHDPAAEIREYGDRIAQIHFKDGDGGSSNAPLGEGHVDFPGVRDAIHDAGYEGWIILESTVESDPIADARRNLRFARELMGGEA